MNIKDLNWKEESQKYLDKGDHFNALRIAKNIRKGKKSYLSNIQLAYECYKNPKFYKQLGEDIDSCIKQGIFSLELLLKETK